LWSWWSGSGTTGNFGIKYVDVLMIGIITNMKTSVEKLAFEIFEVFFERKSKWWRHTRDVNTLGWKWLSSKCDSLSSPSSSKHLMEIFHLLRL
jgi:hypothetical protein